MQIIPVIDVMGGIVVHARGGKRKHYQALQSILSISSEPFDVIAALLTLHDFKTIYIADLDAIQHHSYDIEFYIGLNKRFPGTEFWVDAGIQTHEDWQKIAHLTGLRCVLGSETLKELELLDELLIREQGILSLDYREGVFLGDKEILTKPECWPKNIIVMSLDYVGSGTGPDYSLLKRIKALAIHSNVIAAGGVRNKQDLEALANQKISATLLASALHKGDISTKVLMNF